VITFFYLVVNQDFFGLIIGHTQEKLKTAEAFVLTYIKATFNRYAFS
jgi:hypothetical protein